MASSSSACDQSRIDPGSARRMHVTFGDVVYSKRTRKSGIANDHPFSSATTLVTGIEVLLASVACTV